MLWVLEFLVESEEHKTILMLPDFYSDNCYLDTRLLILKLKWFRLGDRGLLFKKRKIFIIWKGKVDEDQ